MESILNVIGYLLPPDYFFGRVFYAPVFDLLYWSLESLSDNIFFIIN